MQLVSISLALVAHGAPILIVGNQPKLSSQIGKVSQGKPANLKFTSRSPRNRIKLLFTDYRIYRQTQEENHDVHGTIVSLTSTITE